MRDDEIDGAIARLVAAIAILACTVALIYAGIVYGLGIAPKSWLVFWVCWLAAGMLSRAKITRAAA